MTTLFQAFAEKTILIPHLQRDYVQGSDESIIGPFLDALLKSLCSSEDEIDLNYIYGYKETECFVPIDGQQRLTTLWLLHLYIASKIGAKALNEFSIKICYSSREFASDFCDSIKDNLYKVLPLIDNKSYQYLDEAIIDQNWFISSWQSSTTVKSMLITLRYLHQKLNFKDVNVMWNSLKSESPISFSFLIMDGKNLDDDIYIKMNGRGRTLSTFENLKSWMDEQIKRNKTGAEAEWRDKWGTNMDNKWTDFFWQNRNKNQERPEEIDDEQLWCICNLLFIYWNLNKKRLNEHIDELRHEHDKPFFKDLLVLLDLSNEEIPTEKIIEKIFDQLRDSNLFPLVWIERLKLMEDGFLEWVYNTMETLSEKAQVINDLDLFFGADSRNGTSIYDIALCKGSYDRTLPLLYSIIVSGKYNISDIHAWMRLMRNLILNTTIDRKNISGILHNIKSIAEKVQGRDIYEYLSTIEIDADKEKEEWKFNHKQVIEERMKASPEFSELRELMGLMENNKFFRGRIRCMFNLLRGKDEQEDERDILNKDNFDKYSSILRILFGESGIASQFNEQHILRRALISFPPHLFGKMDRGCWSFCSDVNQWRDYLSGDEELLSLRKVIQRLCIPSMSLCREDIVNTLKNKIEKYVEGLSSQYESILSNDSKEEKYYIHFVRHPGVWEYMESKKIGFNGNTYDIFLRRSNSNNSNVIELRTYSLYLDYRDSSGCCKMLEGWKVFPYDKKEGNCFCLHYEVNDNSNKTQIAIDVSHTRTKEDGYTFYLFIRQDETNISEEKVTESNLHYFKTRFGTLIDDFKLSSQERRLQATIEYSREEIINTLAKLMRIISPLAEIKG